MKSPEFDPLPPIETMDDDELERRIGLLLDGRFDARVEERFRGAIEASPRAKRIHASLTALRRALRTAPVAPAPSPNLLHRTLERVAAARLAQEREARVLPWIRGVALAAAVVIAANAWMFRSVRADSEASAVPTVEDRLRSDRQTEPNSLTDYLAWYFLRRDR
jgi:anti-sigma factor RsiW